ncbi:hypothetical protein ABPG73_019678 [Tetrahymena malaccensis]
MILLGDWVIEPVKQSQCCTSETWTHCPVECNGDCCPANQIKICGEQSMCIQKGQISKLIQALESKVNDQTSCNFYDELEKIYTCGEQGYPLKIGKKYCQLSLDNLDQYENQDWQNAAQKCLKTKIVSEIKNTFKEQKAFVCEHLKASAINSYQECFVHPEQNDLQISYCNNPIKDNFKIGLTYFKGGNIMDLASQLGPISCQCILGEVQFTNLIENYALNLPFCSIYKVYDSKKYIQQYVGPYYHQLKDTTSQKYYQIQNQIIKDSTEAKEKINKTISQLKEFSINSFNKIESYTQNVVSDISAFWKSIFAKGKSLQNSKGFMEKEHERDDEFLQNNE